MNLYAFFALTAFFSYLTLGVWVLLLDGKRPLNRIFFYYSLATAAYSFSEFGYLQAESFETAWLWIKVRAIWPFTFATALHFHLLFSQKFSWIRNPFSFGLIYAPAILISILDISTDQVMGTPIEIMGIWGYSPPHDSIWPLLSGLFALGYMLLMTGVVLKFCLNTRKSSSLIHTQAMFILGADVLVILIVIINTFLQQLPDFQYRNVDSAFLFFTNCIIAYSIYRFSMLRLTTSLASGKIVSNMSEFLFLVNPDGLISVANQMARKISGWSKEALEGKSITHLLSIMEVKLGLNLNLEKVPRFILLS